MPDQVAVDLARAEDEARDLVDRHARLAEDGEELRVGKVLEMTTRAPLGPVIDALGKPIRILEPA